MDRAARILHESRVQAEVRAAMRQVMHNQAQNRNPREGTTLCPNCNEGLKMRTFDFGDGATVAVCHGCGWHHKWDRALDEGREPGVEFIPGVTGRRRPTTIVSIGPDGKIREVRNA